jgi:segregation and condensation protein A
LTGNFISIAEDLRGYGTQPFEGPLDLLLYLIRQDEIDIYDIPIAKITHQYLAYLEAMKELDLEIAGEFILMASMLIRIKAQMLLPRPEEIQDEFDDPRSELVKALLEYKRFKLAADQLEKRSDTWHKRYARGDNDEIAGPEVNYVLRKVDINALMVAFGDVLLRARRDKFHHVDGEDIPIEDRIRHIISLLKEKDGVEFYELFADDPRHHVLIVTFMAMLELAKLGQISIRQVTDFGKIWVYPVALDLQGAIKTYEEIT